MILYVQSEQVCLQGRTESLCLLFYSTVGREQYGPRLSKNNNDIGIDAMLS